MANFLPFVVETSTPLYIYQTLITRSKGMNSLLITSIFYLIVDKGIEFVRDVATKIPDMPLDKVYETIISSFPSSRISNEYYQKIQAIGPWVKTSAYEEISEDLKDYELEDIMNFILVMTLLDKLPEYTSLKFEKLFNNEAEKAEENLLAYKLFSNDGKEVVFSSKGELAAYIYFYALIWKRPKRIKAVFSPNSTKFDGFNTSETGAPPPPKGAPF